MPESDQSDTKTSVTKQDADKRKSVILKAANTARQKAQDFAADVIGIGAGAANVGIIAAAQTGKAGFGLTMIPVRHATALGYTGFSVFVVGTGFALNTIGKGIGFTASKTWGAAKRVYSPFSPAVNTAASTIFPPIARAAVFAGRAILAGVNVVSPVISVPLGYVGAGFRIAGNAIGKTAKVVVAPIHKAGKRRFPKATAQAERLASFIADLRPVDALAYPLAGLYMGIRGAYKIVYGILDVTARFVGRRIYNNFPKTSQNVLDGYDIARNKLRDTIQSLPPEKAFGLVAVMSALAYCISPIVGGYYTVYASTEAIRSAAILIPKALKVTAGTTTYLCWDQAKQSKGFEKVKKVYDPFADAVGWIRDKVDAADSFLEKNIAIYATTKKLVVRDKTNTPAPKKYKGKLAKIGSRVIPGYRRADEHQQWMTDYVTSTRAFKLGERGFSVSVRSLQSAWDTVAPYHRKVLDTGARVMPKVDFNKASGFTARLNRRRKFIVDSTEGFTSSLGTAFGLVKVVKEESVLPVEQDKVGKENPAQKHINDHTPR